MHGRDVAAIMARRRSSMTFLYRWMARLLMATTVAFGVRPRIVTLLELLQRPPVQIVAVTRQGRLEYSSLFAAKPGAVGQASADRLAALPATAAERTYIPVRSA
jgi:hypothetical protein